MMKYKGKTLTDEQESHINTILDGNDYAIQAPPGSGKTFLLLALARKMKGFGLSVSFNKLLAIEASRKFQKSTQCKTGHSLAYGAVGYKYNKRLKKLTGAHLANSQDIGAWDIYNSPANKGYLILNTIRKYCYSADRRFKFKHLPQLPIVDDNKLDIMKVDLLDHAQQIFDLMADESHGISITHDVYLKLWALSNPTIRKDYIFFDEYQDSNPVIAQVIKSQQCQKIFVGDQFQQIYAWRGAVNALQEESLTKLHITRSFRFGEAIATVANRIIQSYYPYDFDYVPFHGNPEVSSEVTYDPIYKVDCIICRTNKGVIAETLAMMDRGHTAHILGGTKQLSYLIDSIFQLKIKGYTAHPDLFLFTSFLDLKEYADSPMGGDLKPVLKLLEKYGREKLLSILDSTKQRAEDAEITITTAHKSKGLEWSAVRLANDFKVPTPEFIPSQEDTNILYVATSRALHKLDLSQCQAASPASFALARQKQKEQYQIDQAVHQQFDQVMHQQCKDLQDDVPF
jgi:superfamily I DNA/RNA helicase